MYICIYIVYITYVYIYIHQLRKILYYDNIGIGENASHLKKARIPYSLNCMYTSNSAVLYCPRKEGRLKIGDNWS